MVYTCYLLITSCCFTIPNIVKAMLMISSAKCHPEQWLISKQKDLFTSNNQKTLHFHIQLLAPYVQIKATTLA